MNGPAADLAAADRRLPALLAAIPLLLLPCCWLWWWASGLNPGLQVGRSADLVLLAGSAWAAWRLRRAPGIPTPVPPLVLALAWQVVALLLWAPVREPGLVWLSERAAALGTAVLIAGLAADANRERGLLAAAGCGLGLLALTCLAQFHDLGTTLALGHDAPFGNVNFDVGAALPLCAIALARCWDGSWRWIAIAAGAAILAALLGRGVLGADPCQAVWAVGLATIAAVLLLRLPTRAQLPAFIAVGLVAGTAWLAFVTGALDADRLGGGAGTAQRIHIWRCASESLAGIPAAIGHGPAASVSVLTAQPSFAASWLTVPSFVEHAHNEPLQALLDGGLVLAALLGWALWATIVPLWRRREEPFAAALLVGWCAAAAEATIESHLSQPGGLLGLAILAGLSWSVAGQRPAPRLAPALPAAAATLLAILAVRELAGDGGGPGGIQRRSDLRREHADPDAQLAELDRLRGRLGPLALVDYERARCLGRLHRHEEAAAALAAQLGRVPVHAASLELAARMRMAGRATPDLLAAEANARARAERLLAEVRENPPNAAAREALRRALERDRPGDPAPGR